ncbi:MAG: hypothetical protein EOO89_33260, partial [Pedobacter sp.]
MKHLINIVSCFICLQGVAACSKSNDMISIPDSIVNTASTKLRITVGGSEFTSTLNDNDAATAFRARLPLTISMKDLNANEKYFDLPGYLPSSSSNPGTIQAGDLMLYG